MNDSKVSNEADGVWTYYLVYIVFFVIEGSIVDSALYVANSWLRVPAFGPWLAWILFVLGGIAFGMNQARTTHVDQEFPDPFLKWSCMLQSRAGIVAVPINSIVFGTIGACAALKQVDYPRKNLLYVTSGVVFATFWVPVFLYILPPSWR